jgi:hypothetical protein
VVPVTALWLPILVSALFVFVASSIIHMVLALHRNDFRKVPDEPGLTEAFRSMKLTPGDYCLPFVESSSAFKDSAFIDRVKQGPTVFMTVLPGRDLAMGAQLSQWFLFSVLVSVFAGYIAGAALGPGAEYLQVFRFTGTMAFAGYTLAFYPQSIWYKRPWRLQVLNTLDGLVYALLTAGVFGWLWP